MKDQLTIFDFITEQSEFDRDDFLTWCDSCKYNVKGCCDYDEPLGRVCIEGSGYSRTDALELKRYIATFSDRSGVPHRVEFSATADNLLGELGRCRTTHQDMYFKYFEEA